MPASLLEELCAQALFGILVEGLADRFEPALCDAYARLFAGAVAHVNPAWDPRSLAARYERVRRPRPVSGEPRRVFVLSRVTLGADVAVTSVLLAAAKRRFPQAEIVFAGPAKNYALFAGDERIRHAPLEYRRGSLAERLAARTELQRIVDVPRAIVVDPDSRLTQLGLLPVCPEESYYFFESRARGLATDQNLPELAATWAEEILGVSCASPFVALGQAPRNPDAIAVSLGVGDNLAKRVPDPFEAELLTLLAETGMQLVIDMGAGGAEAERAERAVERSGVRATTWNGSFAGFARIIARSALYVGYDSAGQHVAAACDVPLISVFAGFPSLRFFSRWRPKSESSHVIRMDCPDPTEAISRVREALSCALVEAKNTRKAAEPCHTDTLLRATNPNLDDFEHVPLSGGYMAPLLTSVSADRAAVLSPEESRGIDAWWRTANYLAVGQIYLYANPLLKEPLRLEHIKPRLLGHWGTTPGLNFIYAHANRVIRKYDLDMIYICGPGHGGPGMVANTWLEGTYSELYPEVSQDVEGMQRLFKQFSFPGGIPSHASPETPGSIHEGGELGYSLLHAYGAVLDNPDLVALCVVGDGEAETAPLATSWHSNKFLNAATDGAVLPVLHLNGYKIAGPTVLARIPTEELAALIEGYGYRPYFVEGDQPEAMHQAMAATLDTVIGEIRAIQQEARSRGLSALPRWPMIVLRSPKGWTGPKKVDGVQVEGTFRAHQVPLDNFAQHPEHVALLEQWMKSYRPEELFETAGAPVAGLRALAPQGNRRMSANPHANGGLLLKPLRLPDFRDYAVTISRPGAAYAEATRVLGVMLRDVMKSNTESRNFRVFGPDETASNRLGAVFEVTSRVSAAAILPGDDHVSHDGRVMEVLSEHMCQGWLEGYLLTGRHGFFSCYEAFIHIVDSMFNQHAKWLESTRKIAWRRPIASLTYLLTSHVWRQDHNGFSHQDPGFIDFVMNKKADVVRVYLPPDANCLLSVADHCLRSCHYINVIVAGKQPALQWLDMDAAIKHCTMGISIWTWASNDQGSEPDVVMACAGDVPTMETLAAVDFLRKNIPSLKIRVVNVVDLMTLQPAAEHPHGLSDADFDSIFTKDRPVVFAYHGYPWLIHRLTYRRTNHHNIHVRGYKEEGTTTTPFDMTVLNDLDRFHLAGDVIDRVPGLQTTAAHQRQMLRDKLIEHRQYISRYGDDMPEVRNWQWPG